MGSGTGNGHPLSIGYLSPGWPRDAFPNGIVSYVAGMAGQLPKMGHQVTILADRTTEGGCEAGVYDLKQDHPSRSLAHRVVDSIAYRLRPRWATAHKGSRNVLIMLRRAIAERGIQLFEMEETFGTVARVQRAASIPVCIRLHGPWFINGPVEGVADDDAFRHRVAAEGRAIRQALALTVPSRAVLERVRAFYELPLEQAAVIPNSIEPALPAECWRSDGCDPKHVLFAGRFDRLKGGDVIIEAFGRVLEAVPEARLSFAGPDIGLTDKRGRAWNLEGFIDDRLPGARAAGRVRLLGRVANSNMVPLRREAAVTVVCSRYENFPYAVLEAASMGCPIVAARVGGIPEIIRDGVDGLLHHGGDCEDLAAKVLALLANPGRAAELGHSAALRCKQEFHPLAIANRTVDYYHHILQTAAALSN